MLSSTTASSSSFSVHRARPVGGLEQATATSLASAAPSKMRFLAEAGECLRVRTESSPSSTSCWPVRAIVSTPVSRAVASWLSLHPSPASEASAFSRMRAFTNWRARCLHLRINVLSRSCSSSLSFTTYFFLITHLPQLPPVWDKLRQINRLTFERRDPTSSSAVFQAKCAGGRLPPRETCLFRRNARWPAARHGSVHAPYRRT